jgi:hypothetical protein
MTRTKLSLVIEAPVNGKVGKATFRFLLGGKHAHSDRADVQSDEDRCRLVRRAAKALNVPADKLGALVAAECNNFLDDFSARKKQEAEGHASVAPMSPMAYVVEGGVICRRTCNRDGTAGAPAPLCNFNAAISEEVTLDDGSGETDHTFVIEGFLACGKPLPVVRVRATEFPSLNWTMKSWGSAAIVKAGAGAKDQLREAIQQFSLVVRH